MSKQLKVKSSHIVIEKYRNTILTTNRSLPVPKILLYIYKKYIRMFHD